MLARRWLAGLLVVAVVLGSGAASAQAGPTAAAGLDDQPPPPAVVQGSAPFSLARDWTYQGRLLANGSPVNDVCDFRFTLFMVDGTQSGTTLNADDVAVQGGLFTVSLSSFGQLGTNRFTGEARYLETEVRCGAETEYTKLAPRQALTAAPFALSLPGLYTRPNATAPSVVGGAPTNRVQSGVVGAAVFGGSSEATNAVTDNYGVIGGGTNNIAGNDNGGTVDDADHATVGGGSNNWADGRYSVVGGGHNNFAGEQYSTVAGGHENSAYGQYSTVAGGQQNSAANNYASIGGGFSNSVGGYGSTVPGGINNGAYGDYAFAAGHNAFADYVGSFVWADSGNYNGGSLFAADRENQFKIRAGGGMVISATQTSSLNPAALHVQNGGSNSVAIHAEQTSADAALVVTNRGTGDLIKAFGAATPTLRFRVTNNGDVYADGSYHCAAPCVLQDGAADFAEMLPAAGDLQPGDVLAIGPDGALTRSTQPYQPTVAGVYSTRPSYLGNGAAWGQPGYAPLALVGVVPVRASAENGAIAPGDLLVASATPGHAMRAGPNPPLGTVLGKALEALPDGTGLILMLVMLQ